MVDYTEGTGKQYHTGIGPEDIGGYVIMPAKTQHRSLGM